MLLLPVKRHCRHLVTFRKCTTLNNKIKNNFFCVIHHNSFHKESANGNKNSNYFDYNEDCELLKRLENDKLEDLTHIADHKDALKIKKKYLKLLRQHHPDTYINEKNEQRKKHKEEIFRKIYTQYKNFSKQYDHMHKSEIIDETIYESEEEKSERLERYKRYSEGKRNDILHNIKYSEVYILISILLTFGLVLLICIYLPFNINTVHDELYDSTENGENAEVVSCFYNPVMKRYEYLSGDYIPPHPHQLHYFYKNNFPDLFVDDDILKLNRFEIVQLPKNRAKKCRLVYDLKTNELIFLRKKKRDGEME
ncbi:hypothetical protein, conserved [Plasmodium gonderi]|uniref:J domain-containing protein n=1 Tax=Plasmodium gonderi TaxID=77519 RepID=A0A1Y1JEB3_PLAGO|nr:hypothetical protein, conserved [Plasmodium gonderi]GAW79092.1 hypothetical protein, conserved [Plasmodium gonderi]